MPGTSSRSSVAAPLLAFLAQVVVLLAVYLLFVGEVSRAELIVGTAVALLGTIASFVVWGQHFARLFLDVRLFAQGARLLGEVPRDTWIVLRVLLRQLSGGEPAASLFRTARFDPGGDDARSGTRRALAVGFTSMTPNVIVLDVDREHGVLLYHQLEAAELGAMTRRLGAGE